MNWEGTYPASMALDRCRELTQIVLPCLPAPQRDRVYLAYGELISNAIKASPPDRMIRIFWEMADQLLTLEITNSGTPFQPLSSHFIMPSGMAERGRGLPMVRLLTDSCRYEPLWDGTSVIVTWRLTGYQQQEAS